MQSFEKSQMAPEQHFAIKQFFLVLHLKDINRMKYEAHSSWAFYTKPRKNLNLEIVLHL